MLAGGIVAHADPDASGAFRKPQGRQALYRARGGEKDDGKAATSVDRRVSGAHERDAHLARARQSSAGGEAE